MIDSRTFRRDDLSGYTDADLDFAERLRNVLSGHLYPLLSGLRILIRLVRLLIDRDRLIFLIYRFLVGKDRLVLWFFRFLQRSKAVSFLINGLRLRLIGLQRLLVFLFFRVFRRKERAFCAAFYRYCFRPGVTCDLIGIIRFLFL